MLEGKYIAVLGAGGSGQAAARLAVKNGATVCIYDSGDISDTVDLPEEVIRVSRANEVMGEKTQCDMLVISPGIDTYGSFVASFAKGAREVVGEVELACRFYKGKIVGITGTNGKTTTTELVECIFNVAGMSCVACGNYGVPVAEVVMRDTHPDVLALEVSSFQLETIRTFCPDVSIWLNFDADHLDRYKTLDDYKAAKMRIFKNQTQEQTAIVRSGQRVGEIEAQEVSFTSEHENADYTVKDLVVYYKGEPIIDLSKTSMRGLHNAENVMAATASAIALGVSIEKVIEALVNFIPPAHRCELVRTMDGVEYINDSKATNLHALDSALRSQCRPILLIAGGKDKGLNYTDLSMRLEETVKVAFVYGEIAEQLKREFPADLTVLYSNSVEEAVAMAHEQAVSGDTVLFSPGTSSFDMFQGYEERGDTFRKAVEQLT